MDAGRPTIALPGFVVSALKAHRARKREERMAAHIWRDPGLVGREPSWRIGPSKESMKVVAVAAAVTAILATGCGTTNSLRPPPSVPLKPVQQSSSCGTENGRPPRDSDTYFIGNTDLNTVKSCFLPRYRAGLPVTIGFHWLGVDTTTDLIFSFDGTHLRERGTFSIVGRQRSNASWACQSPVATSTSVTFTCDQGTTILSSLPPSESPPGQSQG